MSKPAHLYSSRLGASAQVTVVSATSRPESSEWGEPGIQFHEWFGPEAVDAPLRVDPRLHEACFPQHPEVFRHGGLGHPELAFELPDGPFRRGQQVQHGAAARLRDDGER